MLTFKRLFFDGRLYLLFAILSLALGVFAQSLIKRFAIFYEAASSGFSFLMMVDLKIFYLLFGLCFYVFSTVFWVLSLKKVTLQIASCILSFSYVVNVLLSHYVFMEAISWPSLIGVFFVFLGVFLIALSCD